MRELVSGPLALSRETRHSRAHDLQFEAYIAAAAQLSGYQASFAEPDIILHHPEGPLAVAAKRPRSLRKIGRHLKDALAQVRGSELPGVIAIEVSHALYPAQCINSNALEGVQEFVAEAGKRAAAYCLKLMRRLPTPGNFIGLLVQVELPAVVRADPAPPHVTTSLRWTVTPAVDAADAQLLLDFARRCEVGLFGERTGGEPMYRLRPS
jgi:hypothetical protein